MSSQSHIKHIIEAAKNNNLIIFVGAGVSRNSGLPSRDELIDTFIDGLEIKFKDESERKSADNIKIAQYYYNEFGENKYYETIREAFSKNSIAVPNKIHKLIDQIKPKHIITTNYDTLIEDQMNAIVNKYEVIKKDKDLAFSKLDRTIIKMHGDLDELNIVLKEDDYSDYKVNHPLISTQIQSLVVNHTILFLGYSLSDSTFNSIMRVISNTLGDNTNNAYFYTTNKLKDYEVDYYNKRHIKVVRNSGDIIYNSDNEINHYQTMISFLDEIICGFRNVYSIYDEIEPFKRLDFIEFDDLVNYAIPDEDVRDQLHIASQFMYEEDDYFKDRLYLVYNEKDKIEEFLIKHSSNNLFLGKVLERDEEHQDSIFEKARLHYNNGHYNECINELSTLSRRFLSNKDYVNFLISEFNVSNLSRLDKKANKEDSYSVGYIGIDFKEKVDQLLVHSNYNDRKIITYLRDEIFSFNFLYKKKHKMVNLFSKVKQEWLKSKNQSGKYLSSNDYFYKLESEFNDLNKTIDIRNLFVRHYKEYISIVDILYEAELYANDLAIRTANDPNKRFSSLKDYFDDNDVDYVFRYSNSKNINNIIRFEHLSKIKLNESASTNMFEKISKLLSLDYSKITKRQFYELERYISTLKNIEMDNPSDTLRLFLESNNFTSNYKDINNILAYMIADKTEKFNDNEVREIESKINENLSLIYSDNKDNFSHKYFYYQSYCININYIINAIEKNHKYKIKIDVPEINNFIHLIECGKIESIDLKKLHLYFLNFFEFLDQQIRVSVTNIITNNKFEYENDSDIYFICMFIFKGLVTDKTIIEKCYNLLVSQVNNSNTEINNPFNQNLEVVLNHIYLLNKESLISLEEIRRDINKNKAKGHSTNFDWFIYEDYSLDNIEELISVNTKRRFEDNFINTQEQKEAYNMFKNSILESLYS